MKKLLIAVDSRPALTVAFATAKKMSDPSLPLWQNELSLLVVETARKFFGSLNDSAIRKALHLAVNIISLALWDESMGAFNPVLWGIILHRVGLRGLTKKGVNLAKACATLPETDYLWGESNLQSSKDLLIIFAEKGYRFYCAVLESRKRTALMVRAGNWIIQLKGVSLKTFRREMESKMGDDFDPLAELLFYFVLERVCKGLPWQPGFYFGPTQPPTIKMKKAEKALALRRYKAFLGKMPAELHSALVLEGRDWFQRFIR